MLRRLRLHLAAPLLLLAFAAVSTASASSSRLARVPQAAATAPDWELGAVHGDEDEVSPPLGPERVLQAIAHSGDPSHLTDLRVSSGTPFAGDRPLLATVSPNGDGLRDRAVVQFRLEDPAPVTLQVMICRKHPTTVASTTTFFGEGEHELVWAPPQNTPPQTYRLLLKAGDQGVARPVRGCGDHRLLTWLPPAPVVRVMGIDAGFTRSTYSPGDPALLRIATDVPSFTLQLFQAGPETQPTTGAEMEGVAVTGPHRIDWSAHRSAPATIGVRLGNWANGIYFARLTAPDGQSYYAPLIIRPRTFGTHRIAVVLHTFTWEAYNHYDANGDGWGDTWYAANDIHTVDLSRPYIQGGAPPKWRMYDVPFLHWLYRTGKQVDFISDQDLEHFGSAATLAHLYDLVVFPFHEEYVTSHMYDLISGYRDLGGNMIFLSSTNLLWKVSHRGHRITRVAEWRTLGEPESRVLGVQYRANDEGRHRGPYTLTPQGAEFWQAADVDAGVLGKWPWLGIEFDMTTALSPAGTQVLAEVDPGLPNPTIRGDMTYYEQGGAKVFSAGTLNFTSSLKSRPFQQLLESVWQRLATP